MECGLQCSSTWGSQMKLASELLACKECWEKKIKETRHNFPDTSDVSWLKKLSVLFTELRLQSVSAKLPRDSTAQFERRLHMLHLSSGDGQYWQIPAEFEVVSRLNLFESHPISEDAFSRQFRKSNIVNPCHDTEDMTLTVFCLAGNKRRWIATFA